MKSDVIEINKSLIPYTFAISLGNEMFKIGVNYNETGDLFVLDLYKLNEATGLYDVVCLGEPLVYGQPLWSDLFVVDKYPALTIIPKDESGTVNAVTWDALGKTCFLCIDNGGDEDE